MFREEQCEAQRVAGMLYCWLMTKKDILFFPFIIFPFSKFLGKWPTSIKKAWVLQVPVS